MNTAIILRKLGVAAKAGIIPLNVIVKVFSLTVLPTDYARGMPIGNAKGVRLTKKLALSLGTTEVIRNQTTKGILKKPANTIPPLADWADLFATAGNSAVEDFADWNITLNDGRAADEVIYK